MLVVHVSVHVKTQFVQAFIQATRQNAVQSLLEPGVARFDVVQDSGDETRFILVEVYKDETAPTAHKQTAHYAIWRDAVADMMATPRSSVKYKAIFPEPSRWETVGEYDPALADTMPGGQRIPV